MTNKGYIGADEKNDSQFFYLNGNKNKFYKTGDIVFKNEYGNYMFVGRLDEQVQIDGYRVELSELEHKTRQYSETANTVAIAKQNEYGNYSLFLFIEKPTVQQLEIKKNLKSNFLSICYRKKLLRLIVCH